MKRFLLLTCLAVAALAAGCTNAGEAATQGPTGASDGLESLGDVSFDGTVWVIGDSITVGAADKLLVAFPDAVINAEVGRKFSKGIDELADMLDQGEAPDVLVFALGTNNGATTEQVNEVMATASGVEQVLFVNVVVPRGWETDTNAAIDLAASTFDKVRIVDWYATASGEATLLRSDGYHPSAEGSEVWASLVAAQVAG